eukprot:gene2557-2798_t
MLSKRALLSLGVRRLGRISHRASPNVIAGAMATIPFKLADIGEGIAEVELLKWFVKEGEKVKSFDRICEVQSDKATVEITSRYDGVIAKLHHSEGSIVKVGSALLDIETGSEGSSQPVLANESVDKGLPKTSHYKPEPASSTVGADNTASERLRAQATPAVRKLAKEYDINLASIQPTGPKGRVTKEDVLLFVQKGNKSRVPLNFAPPSVSDEKPFVSKAASSNNDSVASSPRLAGAGDQKVPIRGVQRLMVKSMTAALQVQHLTYCEEVVFDNIKTLRSELKSIFAKKGVKISYMPLLIKATSMALAQFPILNATVNADVTEMIYHENHNVGIAMDTPKGLVVPVVKQVQNKSIFEIARDLNQLQEAAATNTLTESQLNGGTFSLSNIGSVGGTYAVPVVVVPQVAIGAFGRLQVLPRYVDKAGKPASVELIEDGEASVQPCTLMNVSWSADHRVIDGATVARFSNLWKSYVENPHLMLAEMR